MYELNLKVGEDNERIQQCLHCKDVLSGYRAGNDFHITCFLNFCKYRELPNEWSKPSETPKA